MNTVPGADVDITDALVRGLLAQQHPDLAGLPLERADNGWDNVVYRLGDGLGVRLPRREASHRLLLNEVRWLPFLAPRLPLPVPAAVRRGRPGPGYPYHWAVVPWYEGRSAALAEPGERDAYAAPFAAFLRALHVPAPGDAPRNPVRGVPLASRGESFAERLASGRLPQEDALREIFAGAADAPRHSGPALWIHGDPHPHNLVLRPGTGAGASPGIAAVVDFGDLAAGDPASDLAAAWLHFTRRGREEFRSALAGGSGRPLYDVDTWLRARGWAVHLGAMMALLPKGDPLRQVGRHTLDGVLEEFRRGAADRPAVHRAASGLGWEAGRKEHLMKKILMVLTSVSEIGDTGEKTGYNVAEAAHPWKVFKDSGHFVDFASIQGGQPPRDEVDTEDPIQVAFTEDETTRAGLYNTARVDVVDSGQYDAVFLVGGHGTMWDFPDSEGLQKLVSGVYNAGGVVGAVCHGPAGLVNVELANGLRLVEGRKVAAFTNEEEVAAGKDKAIPFFLADRLEEQGATHVSAGVFEEKVVVDERLVTGQNPASAAGVAKEMEKLLAEVIHQEKAEEQSEAEALRAEKDAEKDAKKAAAAESEH